MFLTNIILINVFIIIATNINVILQNININRLTQYFIYLFLITLTCINAHYFNPSHDIVVFASKFGDAYIKSEYTLSGLKNVYLNFVSSQSIITLYNVIEYQPLWKIINIVFYYLNFNFNTFYIFTIIFLFLSFNYFCNIFFEDKKQRITIKLIFFCFTPFLDMIYIHIQSSVALSFFFIFLSNIVKRHFLIGIFFYLLSVNIHYSMILFLPLIFINQLKISHLIILILFFYLSFLILFSGNLLNYYQDMQDLFYGSSEDYRIQQYHLYLLTIPTLTIISIYYLNFTKIAEFFFENKNKILLAMLILLSSSLLIIGENLIYVARINDFNKIVLLLIFISYIFKFFSKANITLSLNIFLILNIIYLGFF